MLLAARSAGLRYVNPSDPGIRRVRRGTGFSYLDRSEQIVTDEETVARIRKLAIPPAWSEVWISPSPNGHIQATGRDARGRLQYRYHPLWTRVRDDTKYERTIAFARALPRLRRQVDLDLARRGLPREKVVATVVRLLETTLVRVGNEEYAKQNRSFGLTTLRNRHARVRGTTLKLTFRGKSGKEHSVGISDRRVARIVRACQELPGQHLFQYVDDDGVPQRVESDDVNEYLRAAMGDEFTAKDFRTWAGTVLAARAFQAIRTEEADASAPTKAELTRVVEDVAKRLGNTPAVCRKCYIHPQIIDSYLDGTLAEILSKEASRALESNRRSMDHDEKLVLSVLRRRLAADARKARRVNRKAEQKAAA